MKSANNKPCASRTFLLLWALLAAVASGPVSADHKADVLVINSYQHDFRWTKKLNEGLRRKFVGSHSRVQFYHEHMDARNFPLQSTRAAFTELMYAKYQRPLDLVIATDNDAFRFVIENKRKLFDGVPVVFAGVNYFDMGQLDGNHDVYGIRENPDIEATIKFLLHMHRDARRLLVISDSSESGKQVLEEVKTVTRLFPSALEWEFYSEWTREELAQKLRSQSEKTVVLSIALYNDRNNRFFNVHDAVTWTRAQTELPIYTMWNSHVRLGFTGGVVIDGTATGERLGELALDLLHNRTPEQVVFSSPNVKVLNYLEQQRLGIPATRIDDSVVLINQPVSFYYQHWRSIWVVIAVVLLQTLTIAYLVYNIRNRHKAEKALEFRANNDFLTQLPSRESFHDHLESVLDRGGNERRFINLIFLDLNNFKRINDNYGHRTGDAVLREIATRLCEVLGSRKDVARLSGDEFVMIVETSGSSSEEIMPFLIRLKSRVEAAVTVDGHDFFLTASMGIACYPEDGATAVKLLGHADIAMFQAKLTQKSSSVHAFYNKAFSDNIHRRRDIDTELRQALQNDELSILYQPLVDDEGVIVGAEALLRWNSKALGPVSPAEFIPIAEESGWIMPIGEWVIAEACKELRSLHDAGYPVTISINVSYRQFMARTVLESVRAMKNKLQLPDGSLCLEMTERILVEDLPWTMDMFRELKQLGVQLAIDDFGTGYSSLSYVSHYPFDKLKIDKSFILDLDDNNDQLRMIQGIKSIADAMGIDVVVEGVETAQQWSLLKRLALHEFQGYLFARPMAASDLRKQLEQRVLQLAQD